VNLSGSPSDLAKACRQDVWTEYVVPTALEQIRQNPKAGGLYEGELVVALKLIRADFWPDHKDLATKVRDVVERTLAHLDDEVRQEVQELLSRLS
jgi:predicted Rdx family selenoprotein